jgi:hypothetical protein
MKNNLKAIYKLFVEIKKMTIFSVVLIVLKSFFYWLKK